ncbi:MAG TPA: hypothetical protein VMI06_12180 [Terriglobia bacterium]|nr:hypothetical protein [Terriglobia bacterium]
MKFPRLSAYGFLVFSRMKVLDQTGSVTASLKAVKELGTGIIVLRPGIMVVLAGSRMGTSKSSELKKISIASAVILEHGRDSTTK